MEDLAPALAYVESPADHPICPPKRAGSRAFLGSSGCTLKSPPAMKGIPPRSMWPPKSTPRQRV
eukprot:9043900-Pyramimonas_sp.AAC.1